MATMNTITSCNESEYVNDDAASSDHLECLKYLYENERIWDKWVSENHLDCLEYFFYKKDDCEFEKKIYY